MNAARIAAVVVGAAGFLAALIYLGRQLGRLATLLQFLTGLPARFDSLETATEANTLAIKTLTRRLDNGQVGRRRRGAT